MTCPRSIVFDDAPQDRRLGWTADQFADALRSPLAAIGVRVVRQHSVGFTSPIAGFRVRGCSRSQYNSKLDSVCHVVNGVLKPVIRFLGGKRGVIGPLAMSGPNWRQHQAMAGQSGPANRRLPAGGTRTRRGPGGIGCLPQCPHDCRQICSGKLVKRVQSKVGNFRLT
jgi:hypothetical protein